MSNPFANLLTQPLQDIYNNSIDAMLQREPSGFAVPCSMVYIGTSYEACPNCGSSLSTIGKKPSNIYLQGAPVPLQSSQNCAMCDGTGKVTKVKETSEAIDLVPIWDYRSWVGVQIDANKTPDGSVQTLSAMSTVNQLKRCSYLLINTDIQVYEQHKFERDGEPNPGGFGVNRYVFTLWKKV